MTLALLYSVSLLGVVAKKESCEKPWLAIVKVRSVSWSCMFAIPSLSCINLSCSSFNRQLKASWYSTAMIRITANYHFYMCTCTAHLKNMVPSIQHLKQTLSNSLITSVKQLTLTQINKSWSFHVTFTHLQWGSNLQVWKCNDTLSHSRKWLLWSDLETLREKELSQVSISRFSR